MRIRVLINYGGKPSGGRRIEPGDYDEGDERLFGLADYLVTNGHAEVISGGRSLLKPEKDEKQEDLQPDAGKTAGKGK